MPPPQPQPKVPIPTPLPTPLPAPLLTTLTTALLTANAIPPILRTLTLECQKAKWQDAVKARIMQMLKDEGYVDKAEMLRVLVREARGLEEEGEGEGDDDGGDGGVQKGRKDGKGGEGRIDVRVPEKAVSEGVKVVKGYLEKVVEVEPEVVDFWSS
ncbi:hypothetical protein JMJ35_009809 [Cladonia borealis]|uniref:Uncharacterized protein n=1 Tax=Cladonia borealis TaxID=184061 RepID=A0AA39QTS7_9LECA|nr:hypothetical protein JMJ35_009809 [Cladonia borealis]